MIVFITPLFVLNRVENQNLDPTQFYDINQYCDIALARPPGDFPINGFPYEYVQECMAFLKEAIAPYVPTP